jgi:hypothetical protein
MERIRRGVHPNLLMAAIILLLSFSLDAASQNEVCFYGSKGFAADVTFRRHGATCQQCSTQAGGSWVDRTQGCETSREKRVLDVQPHGKVCSDSDGLAYSEGAIFDDGGQCKRCQGGQWFPLDRKAFCKP